MCVCVYVCICMDECMYIDMCIFVCVNDMYHGMCVCTWVDPPFFFYFVYMIVCVYVCMCMDECLYRYVYICV